ncbi:hypothetical protein NL676_035629 [Syzygium grande]|nr:hypothetical protein NL676_035629 [Syzygium grande]
MGRLIKSRREGDSSLHHRNEDTVGGSAGGHLSNHGGSNLIVGELEAVGHSRDASGSRYIAMVHRTSSGSWNLAPTVIAIGAKLIGLDSRPHSLTLLDQYSLVSSSHHLVHIVSVSDAPFTTL